VSTAENDKTDIFRRRHRKARKAGRFYPALDRDHNCGFKGRPVDNFSSSPSNHQCFCGPWRKTSLWSTFSRCGDDRHSSAPGWTEGHCVPFPYIRNGGLVSPYLARIGGVPMVLTYVNGSFMPLAALRAAGVARQGRCFRGFTKETR